MRVALLRISDINNQSKGFQHFPLAFVKGVVGAEVDMYTAVKNRIFSHDVCRTGMVISVGKVCAFIYFPHSAFSTLRTFHTHHFPHSAFSTLRTFHTPHSALRTPHSALRTPHSALRTPHSALRTPHSALRTPHSALRTPHSASST